MTMTSRPLTKRMKSDLLHRVMNKTLKRRRDRMVKREGAIANALRNFSLGKYKDTYLSLPVEFQQRRGSICLMAEAPWSAEYFSFPAGLAPCPQWDVSHGDLAATAAGRKLLERAYRFLRDQERLNEDSRQLRQQVEGVLARCNTTGTLAKAWPEALEFLPEHEKPMSLPAVPVDMLKQTMARVAKEPK